MIECQYCYTRNKQDAPKCEACGAPLSDTQLEDEDVCVFVPHPAIPNKFIVQNKIPLGFHAREHLGLSDNKRRLLIDLIELEQYIED